MRRLAPLFVLAAALGVPERPTFAGNPPPTDPAAGLLDPSADARAAAATRIGALDLVAAAPAIPVLVEALDDEAPAVRAASRAAILDLANRAAPSVLRDLAEAPIDGPDSAASVVLMLGPALTPADFAHGLESGDADLRDVWVALALFGPLAKSALRMTSIEAGRRRGPEQAGAAAAAAFFAFRAIRTHAWEAGEPLPPLAASGADKALAALLPAKAKGPRAEFAAQFVAVTGIGDGAVVEGLKALLAAPPVAGPASGPFPDRGVSLQAAEALGRLSATVPAAKAALEALDDAHFSKADIAVARGGATSMVASRAAGAPPEDRVTRAANAILEGDVRDAALVPVLVPALGKPTLSIPGRLAANALGRLGPGAAAAVPALEAALRVNDISHADRVDLAGALVRIRPGHEAAQAALVGEATGRFGKPDPKRGASEVEARGLAIEALADAGTGPEVAAVLLAAVAPSELAGVEDVLRRALTVQYAARGLARAAKRGDPASSAALVALLGTKLPGDDADESAAGVVKSGSLGAVPYVVRAAALDGLAALGTVSGAEGARVRALLSSPDPRIRYRAARALRLVKTGDK